MDTLAGMMASHCKKYQSENFALALNRMIAALKKTQLNKASITVEARVGDRRIGIYEESLRRAQAKLIVTLNKETSIENGQRTARAEVVRGWVGPQFTFPEFDAILP